MANGAAPRCGSRLARADGCSAITSSLRERVAAGLAPLGYSHRLGIAPTPQGAALLARAGLAASAVTRAQLLQLLAPLPLALLTLPDEQLARPARHGPAANR